MRFSQWCPAGFALKPLSNRTPTTTAKGEVLFEQEQPSWTVVPLWCSNHKDAWKTLPRYDNIGHQDDDDEEGEDVVCSASKALRLASDKDDTDDGVDKPPSWRLLLTRLFGGSSTWGNQRDENRFVTYAVAMTLRIVLQADAREQVLTLCTDEYDNHNEKRSRDDDDELRGEAWTWVQMLISWADFRRIHAHVKQLLCVVLVPHPLAAYASHVVPTLTEDELHEVIVTLQLRNHFSNYYSLAERGKDDQHSEINGRRSRSNNDDNNEGRCRLGGGSLVLRLMQVLHDKYAARPYGILPFPSMQGHGGRISFRHSCLPNTVLELGPLSSSSSLLLSNKRKRLLRWVALEDLSLTTSKCLTFCSLPLDGTTLEREGRQRCGRHAAWGTINTCTELPITTSITMNRDCSASCPLCLYQQQHNSHKNNNRNRNSSAAPNRMEDLSWQDAVRLGHYQFQQGQYGPAETLYHLALGQISSCTQQSHSPTYAEACDDIWHALGAIQLSLQNFLRAQFIWKQTGDRILVAGDDRRMHSGIALQLEKIEAYHYLDYAEYLRELHEQQQRQMQALASQPYYPYESHFDDQCFVTPCMLDPAQCRQIIDWAIQQPKAWTTQRHYAVPTHDVPVHKIPALLDWFQKFFFCTCVPMLKRQFLTLAHKKTKLLQQQSTAAEPQFHIHDAFCVRYQAHQRERPRTDSTKTTNHLPCHLDESTHSMVFSLNDDFEGGGTYFYDYDSVLAPRQGDVISFKGDALRHGGNAVTKGTRYILAVFIYLDYSSDNSETSGAALTATSRSVQSMFQEAKGCKTDFCFGFDVLTN